MGEVMRKRRMENCSDTGMFVVYMPFIRVNEAEEKQIRITEELRDYLENHPERKGDDGYFEITLTEDDIEDMVMLCDGVEEKKLVSGLSAGDYIIIEPRVYVCVG